MKDVRANAFTWVGTYASNLVAGARVSGSSPLVGSSDSAYLKRIMMCGASWCMRVNRRTTPLFYVPLLGSWASSVRLCSSPVLDAHMSRGSTLCCIRRSPSFSYQDMGIHMPRLAATHRRLECTRNQVTPWPGVTEMVAAVSLRCKIKGELACCGGGDRQQRRRR